MASSTPERAGDDGCRYCGIQPEQELPRPSYYEMRLEVERQRGEKARVKAALYSCWYEYKELMPDALRDEVKAALGLREFTGQASDA